MRETFVMAGQKGQNRDRVREARHDELVRRGAKLASDSRQLIRDAKCLVDSSLRLIEAVKLRQKRKVL